ncbi:MAG: HAD-IA family hydrolase [Patescibacteria group bacterium]|nr:HAD-IA family hydrolase [Patescibacteria group bacterium]
MKWNLIIFDWNGTALNDLPLVYGSVCSIFKTYGVKPPTLKTYREEITADFMKFYRHYGIPKTASHNDLNKLRARYFEKNWNKAKLRPGVKLFLEQLDKIPDFQTAIVSAEITEVLSQRLCGFNIIVSLLDKIIGNAWDKEKALLDTIDTLGVKTENAVYVDDTFDGLTAAKNLGIHTIGFTAGYNTKKRILAAKPDFPNSKFPNINNFRQIAKIIGYVNNIK